MVYEIGTRAGFSVPEIASSPVVAFGVIHPRFGEIKRRAAALRGCDGIAGANDAGIPFTQIATALDQARAEIEASAP